MRNRPGIFRALIGLSIFGAAYAYFVARLGDKHKGYTWTLVVAGESVIMLTMGRFIGWKNTMILFAAHAAAGVWMALGDIIKGINYAQKLLRGYQDLTINLATRGMATDSKGEGRYGYSEERDC